MIEELATVRAVEGNEAVVVVSRQSACGSCAARGGCGTSLLAGWFPQRQLTFRLANDVGATAGDRVVVGLQERDLQTASLWLYAVPLVGLLGGAVAGERLFAALAMTTELGAILSGLLGLSVALWLVRRHSVNRLRDGAGGVRLLRLAQPVSRTAGIDVAFIQTQQVQSFRNRQ